MSFRAMVLKRSWSVAFLITLTAANAAFAQVIKSPVEALTQARIGQDAATTQLRVIQFANEEAITTSFVPPPNVGSTSGSGVGDQPNWLKVEFHFSVNPADARIPWVDSAEFKVWIEGRDLYAANAPAGSTQGVAVCLTGSVTYVNLAAAKDAYGVVYVHPSALSRYCGTGTYDDFDRKFNIHIEANVGGKLVDYYDKRKDVDKWWTGPTPVPNLVFRQDQSPFVLADVARYPQIKLQAPATQ